MVGRPWSAQEERYFWREAVPHSPKRVGDDVANVEKSWDLLALEMQIIMGEHARREYNPTMLAEHLLKNIGGHRQSPHAGPYIREYLARRDGSVIVSWTTTTVPTGTPTRPLTATMAEIIGNSQDQSPHTG